MAESDIAQMFTPVTIGSRIMCLVAAIICLAIAYCSTIDPYESYDLSSRIESPEDELQQVDGSFDNETDIQVPKTIDDPVARLGQYFQTDMTASPEISTEEAIPASPTEEVAGAKELATLIDPPEEDSAARDHPAILSPSIASPEDSNAIVVDSANPVALPESLEDSAALFEPAENARLPEIPKESSPLVRTQDDDLRRISNDLSSQNIFPPTTRRVVVVGNGMSVQGSNAGELIDTFGEVVRFNLFKTKGYEKDAGTKATNWVISSIKDPKDMDKSELRLVTRAMVLLPDGSKSSKVKETLLRLEKSPKLPKKAKIWSGVLPKELAMLREKYGLEEKHVSSGLQMLAYHSMNPKNRPVSFIGFDFETGSHQHYWEQKVKNETCHNMGGEAAVLQKMVDDGLLHRLLPRPVQTVDATEYDARCKIVCNLGMGLCKKLTGAAIDEYERDPAAWEQRHRMVSPGNQAIELAQKKQAAKERRRTAALIVGGLATLGATYPPEEDTSDSSMAAKRKLDAARKESQQREEALRLEKKEELKAERDSAKEWEVENAAAHQQQVHAILAPQKAMHEENTKLQSNTGLIVQSSKEWQEKQIGKRATGR
ncbi:hypothetical protein CYMTET_42564 [Cymbomonas tetramitiformis]|uniref:Uncharacterized protein n=1 Tax=Cymbomonas tetramitiformis TaxID=36881 RepID=A0AAE0C3T2_9CHLO|nr:hypothetical protein CYMTET_42564 [Cymbomonas tetramitiformis]